MSIAMASPAGRIVSIWRYPVKSMMGEELNASEVTQRGLLGDRAYALIDEETGKAASAKNPRRWPNLFDFRASFVDEPADAGSIPPARITFPDGESLTTDRSDAEARLSAGVGRAVRLARSGVKNVKSEGYWPDHDWLPDRDQVFEFQLPEGTLFDGGPVHLLTTATLNNLRTAAPGSKFEVRRFRPNLVVEAPDNPSGYIENAWIGKTLAIGEVRLRIEGPTPRCVMTTLAQSELPRDPHVLRTAVQQNEGNVGVYATVIHGGRIRRGDTMNLV